MPVDGYVEPRSLALECVRSLESSVGSMMGADRVFFSGGEPTIQLPYIEGIVQEARRLRPAMKVNFDTNGFMTEESLGRVLDLTTSITFDLKAFHDDTMRALTGAAVEPVLRNAEIVAKKARDKLWEFRIVVVPEINEEDIEPLCRFIARMRMDLPVCFLAFRPNYVLEEHRGATRELMRRCLGQAREAGLTNVTTAGFTGIGGREGLTSAEVESAYQRRGARIAGSYAHSKGCCTHPRDCGKCPSSQACPLKSYIPRRSC
jgi:pyruvate formate lyase activating enzyme